MIRTYVQNQLTFIRPYVDESVNQVFELNKDTGQVFLISQLNRSVASYYDVSYLICLFLHFNIKVCIRGLLFAVGCRSD